MAVTSDIESEDARWLHNAVIDALTRSGTLTKIKLSGFMETTNNFIKRIKLPCTGTGRIIGLQLRAAVYLALDERHQHLDQHQTAAGALGHESEHRILCLAMVRDALRCADLKNTLAVFDVESAHAASTSMRRTSLTSALHLSNDFVDEKTPLIEVLINNQLQPAATPILTQPPQSIDAHASEKVTPFPLASHVSASSPLSPPTVQKVDQTKAKTQSTPQEQSTSDGAKMNLRTSLAPIGASHLPPLNSSAAQPKSTGLIDDELRKLIDGKGNKSGDSSSASGGGSSSSSSSSSSDDKLEAGRRTPQHRLGTILGAPPLERTDSPALNRQPSVASIDEVIDAASTASEAPSF